MAARENQGLQIALILFVMITVMLAVTTYIYYRKAEEKIKEAQAANDATKTANAKADAHEKATELLKAMLGAEKAKNEAELKQIRDDLAKSSLPVKDEIKKIEEQFIKDIQDFGAEYAGEKTYPKLPGYLRSIIDGKTVEIDNARNLANTLRIERDNAVKGEAEKTATTQAALQVALADKDKVKADFDVDRTRFTTEQTDLGGKVAEKAKELKEKTDTFTKDITTRDTMVDKLSKLNQGFAKKIQESREETFEVPDGKITWVNQKSNVVWVNIGSADGLRRQTTFSVFDKNETNLKKADAKGSIEVTKIIDEHLAECRILDDSTGDPLLPGDLAFSPIWHPGQTLRFALAGLIDYNNDGKSDRALVMNLILMNGGIVDAEVADDGKSTGKLTVDTRYLVVGKRPSDTSTKEALDGFTKIQSDAVGLGVEQISVTKLLDFMGYKGDTGSVALGRGADGSQFKTKNADGVVKKSTGTTAEFKKRGAPERGKAGAY